MNRFLPERLRLEEGQEFAIHPGSKKVGISIIVPNKYAATDIKIVNKAINTIAEFTSGVLPLDENIVLFELNDSNGKRLNFWIQDEFLALEEIDEFPFKKPIDDSLGRIEHIAFSYYSHGNENRKNSYNKIYIDLIFKIATSFNRRKPLKLPEGKLLFFLENRVNAEIEDVANALKENLNSSHNKSHLRAKAIPSKLMFKGGNVLFIGDFALVGYNSILETSIGNNLEKDLSKYEGMVKGSDLEINFHRRFAEYENKFKILFSSDTGVEKKNIIFIGSKENLAEAINLDQDFFKTNGEEYTWTTNGRYSAQGIYHIDLFISAAGKDRFSDCNRLVIGEPIHSGDNYIPAFNYSKKIIDCIADDLVAKGFAVYRNPLPLTYIDRQMSNDGRQFIKRKWVFASYNNCIVQYTKKPDERYVWMPIYGSDFSNEYIRTFKQTPDEGKQRITKTPCGDWSDLKQYDIENKRIWESLGFRVEKLTNYLPFAELRGATRCFSKIIYRSPY